MHYETKSNASMYQEDSEDVQEEMERKELPPDISKAPKPSIGVNLRVTGHSEQGGRKYMEDYFAVAYQQTNDDKDLEYAFFGIFDGHGGAEAAAFAKEHLMSFIVKDPRFWMEDDDAVLQSIKDGFIDTHHAMWRIHSKWKKTPLGLPSTAGTTASVAFIRRCKIYIGHVGDSGITLGFQNPGCPDWQARSLTKDHKPENEEELARIEQSGGKVISKMGVPRVVWNRPRLGHKGPVRRSTPIDEIPFLAVARSLGDLWSYNATLDEFVVSPKPDVMVVPIDTSTFRCLIFGTDGLFNMLSSQMAVHIVQETEKRNDEETLHPSSKYPLWINPSKALVEKALERWCSTKMRADNTSVITILLNPLGPRRDQVLRRKQQDIEMRAQELERQRLEKASKLKVNDTADPVDNIGHESNIESTKDLILNPRPCTSLEKCDADGDIAEKDASDIQINEISSSSVDEEKQAIKKKSKQSGKKAILIQRKFNLRSNQTTATNRNLSSQSECCSMPGNRAPLGENVPEIIRLSSVCESRVLRERRNTTPNINNGDNKVIKKKHSMKQISIKKKKLLQTFLFKNKDAQPNTSECTSSIIPLTPQPKTKENSLKQSSSKSSNSGSSSKHMATRSTPNNCRRSERMRQGEFKREMRKSTLEQKRTPEGIFKAKLRAKLKRKNKARSLI